MKYFKKLTGKRVYLSPINPDDYEYYTKWLNDPEVTSTLGAHKRTTSLIAERAYLEQAAKQGYNFAIVRLEDNALLGGIGFHEINHESRKTTLGIFIGEAENRSRGYGAEAIKLMLEFGFNTLNLHNIGLTMHADNEQGLACYKKVGFTEYGRRHEATFKHGRYYDVICMEILEDDFRGIV